MKSLEKLKLEVAANYDYTDEELESLSEILDQAFDVEIKRYEEFQESYVGPIIIFILYGISSGFFQSIGENLWNIIKGRLAYLVAKKSKDNTSDLEFSVKTEKETIRFRISSNNAKIIEKAIEQFPKTLESAEKGGYPVDYFEFDTIKEEWTP